MNCPCCTTKHSSRKMVLNNEVYECNCGYAISTNAIARKVNKAV